MIDVRWESSSADCLKIGEGGFLVAIDPDTCSANQLYALGSCINTDGGLCEWKFGIEKSTGDRGAGMCVGAADGTGETNTAWIMPCYDGGIGVYSTFAAPVSYRVVRGSQPSGFGAHRGRSEVGEPIGGATIVCSAERRSDGSGLLHISANSEAAVPFEIPNMPKKLRPFVTFNADPGWSDAVRLLGHDIVLTCQGVAVSEAEISVSCFNLAGVERASVTVHPKDTATGFSDDVAKAMGDMDSRRLRLITSDGTLLEGSMDVFLTISQTM